MEKLKLNLWLVQFVVLTLLLTLVRPAIATQPEVLVKWRSSSALPFQRLANPDPRSALPRLGAEYRPTVGESRWDVVALPEGTDVRAWVTRVRNDPAVAHVEPNRRYRAFATVNDRLFPQLYGLTQIGAPTAWDTTNGNASVVVAVFDTGLNLTHPDLAPVL